MLSIPSYGQVVQALPPIHQVPAIVGQGLLNAGNLIARVYVSGIKALASIPVFTVGAFLEGLFAKGTWSYGFTSGKVIPIFTPSGEPSIGAPVIKYAKQMWGNNPWLSVLGTVTAIATIVGIVRLVNHLRSN